MDLGFRGDFKSLGSYYEANPYRLVFANELNNRACETYQLNLNHKPICEDIRILDYKMLPEADIILGGFPCQDFSLSGKREGLSAERGQLYLEMKKIIQYIRPKAFVAENVDGIRKCKTGENTSALDIIIKDFEKSGYITKYNVLNSANYGVPQNRIRIIIVGIRKDLNKTMKFPCQTHGTQNNPYVTSEDAIDDLWDKLGTNIIANHTYKDYSKAKFYLNKKTQGNCKIPRDKPSFTIRAEHHGNIEAHYRSLTQNEEDNMENWRRLSVRECARLQSFPDEFIFPCAASTAYKQIGNAVPPILGWHIARALYKSLYN
ncbi:DNA (cytosine-5-)-methyltransferase [Candidatus Epulonipiscium fishelsonii]|uniref:DNA (Cytosine-5-)-methyltransferase n=1 Tax=Candidatus Epulonipiscium fishelsonii TaxID=77094 RepID=A0ACC8X9I6_9FIRM|nr:DNA (cytosine-5-)-methyltransferase [Epulopiscium sp. SCG-B11WGA-EpuloA1]